MVYFLGISDSGGAQQMCRRSAVQVSFLNKPFQEFETVQPQYVFVLVGKSPFLTCMVRNLNPPQIARNTQTYFFTSWGAFQVSSVKHHDVHIFSRRTIIHFRPKILIKTQFCGWFNDDLIPWFVMWSWGFYEVICRPVFKGLFIIYTVDWSTFVGILYTR